MSCSVDVNILLYASDASSEHHAKAAAFLKALAERNEACYLSWLTIMSYLRMATHSRIYSAPLTPAEAMTNIERLLARPHVRTLSEGDGYWAVYTDVARETPVRGNLVPDAHLAALLKQHGIRTLYTHDRDFLKFSFLRVIDPFAE